MCSIAHINRTKRQTTEVAELSSPVDEVTQTLAERRAESSSSVELRGVIRTARKEKQNGKDDLPLFLTVTAREWTRKAPSL